MKKLIVIIAISLLIISGSEEEVKNDKWPLEQSNEVCSEYVPEGNIEYEYTLNDHVVLERVNSFETATFALG